MGRSCLRDSPGLSPLPLLDTKPCGAQPVTKPCGAQLPRLCPTELRAGKGIAQSREHPGSGSTGLHSAVSKPTGQGAAGRLGHHTEVLRGQSYPGAPAQVLSPWAGGTGEGGPAGHLRPRGPCFCFRSEVPPLCPTTASSGH